MKRKRIWNTNYPKIVIESYKRRVNDLENRISSLEDSTYIICDDYSNPELMAVARSLGWVAPEAYYMTKDDASKVTYIGPDYRVKKDGERIDFSDLSRFRCYDSDGNFYPCVEVDLTDLSYTRSDGTIYSFSDGWLQYLSEDGEVLVQDDTWYRTISFSELVYFDELAFFTNVTHISGSAFYYCMKLKSLVLPPRVEVIGMYAFYLCPLLNQVRFPSTLRDILSQAFQGCYALTEVNIPDSVRTIGASVFYGCSNITEISIGKRVAGIPKSAFDRCNNIRKVTWKADIVTTEMFNAVNAKITELVLDGVMAVNPMAFADCHLLETVSFGENLDSIYNQAFYRCWSLKNVVLPNSLKSVGERVFEGCNSLKRADIPGSLQTIGPYMFHDCEELEKVLIGYGVKSISVGAFANCTSLTSVNIPGSVVSISGSFKGSGLVEVTIGKGVKSISGLSFSDCRSLKSVTIGAEEPPRILPTTFQGCSSDLKFYVPVASVEDYKAAENWSEYADVIFPYTNDNSVIEPQ